ncbi:MAG: 1-acyl-sn-glycerol-3-phosphate acyltransferase [Gemmatimonadales bacterium]|nr:MAG: 1-acyl-sn-glycerol-3-phosphate acyltransferase [Gemmatimonadales bacterium]
MLGPIRDVFGGVALKLREQSAQPRTISSEAVFQTANSENLALIDGIIDQLVLPGSGVLNVERFDELYERTKKGESCLILMEHYSNFDIPCLFYLLTKSGRRDLAESIIAIAGMKLNEDSGFVVAFAEAYTRIVIYPSRSLSTLSDPALLEQETRRSREINMAATRQMIRLKHRGHMILLFPSGTRYREGNPETKRAVKEVDSYIKSFDWMVCLGTAGNVLRIDPDGDMSRDLTARDTVILSVSEIERCHDFRDEGRRTCPSDKDPKQHVSDLVMDRLEVEHERACRERDTRMETF